MKIRYLIVLFFLTSFGLGIAQEKKTTYKFKHLNTNDGLSQSSVIAMEQDTLGRMWVGTRDGLNLYDGTDFKVFRLNVNDSTSISSSDILAIMEDAEGYIWIGTYNGLNRYDPAKEIFKRYFHSNEENSLCNNTVWAITETNDGEIWVGTSNGLSIYDKNKDSFTSVYSSNSKNSLPSNYVLSVEQSNSGEIWVGTSKGFCKVVQLDNQITFQSFWPEDKREVPFVQSIKACNGNSLCIGTKNMGLLKFDLISERFIPDIYNGPDKDVRAIAEEKNGSLWVGTSNGVVVINAKGKSQKLVNQPYEDGSLSQNYIKSIYTDKKGSIWIGSYYGGIDIWDDSNTNFINFGEFSEKNRLSSKVVSSIVADDKGSLYFGTEGGGITIFKSGGQQPQYLTTSNSQALLTNNIKSLYYDNELLWVGTFNKGLKVYDIGRQRFDDSVIPEHAKSLLSDAGVYAIRKGFDNQLWIGTFGDGLVLLDLKEKVSSVFKNEAAEPNSLSSNRIRSLMIDNSANVWVGTQSGLNLLPYSSEGYKSKNISRFFYDTEMGSGDDVLSIFQDNSGTIWVGIRAKGLYKFDGNDFLHIPINTGKMITSIYAILQEDDGVLWMSSNQGLIRYEINTGNSAVYTQKDGLIGNEFSSDAALKIGESNFYFGGVAGVSSFDSDNIDINDFAPQVILTGFRIKNEPVSPKDENNILSASLPYTEEVSLTYDRANFSINYAIPNFINPGSNQYQYRMVGLDENWTITEQTQANYTIQKPGNYIFEVKGANNDGVWNTHATALKIMVKPAPWLSGWAFALYGFLILGAIIGLGNMIRSRTKLKHELQLELVESERNQEINDAKLRFFTNISHEFRTPLTLITGPLQQILIDYKGSSVVYKKLLVIESNAKHLLQLINRLMDFRKLEYKDYDIETAEGNMVKFLREIYLSFSEFAKCNGYRYSFDTDNEEISVFYDRPKLEQVFFNLISNAFKYTLPEGEVAITVRKGADSITVDISDSGPGIADEYRDKVFDRFFEIPDYKKSKNGQGTGTGIGLSIAKSIVDMHKGSIFVINNPTGGSVFKVSLPLGRAHLKDKQIIKDFKFSDDLEFYESQPTLATDKRNDKAGELMLDYEKATILLVEDNVPLRNFMKDLLKETYNVLVAGDGQEAFKKALKHVPDLIVSDVIMPLMVGTELCSKIKGNLKTSHIPLVLLTSRTSLLYKFEGLESGADDYISKPFDVREFQLRIKNLIDSSKRLRHKFSSEQRFTPNEIVVSSIDEQLLKKALQIVEDNVGNEQFDIPMFSSELGVSRTLLFTKIKAWTNFTPNEFIQEIRMKRAAQLIEQGKLNISEISYKVGFKNPKYFSKCFQKKFGASPTIYQEKFYGSYLE
ncbi:hybrid sensor histidine kinase/response regulator transcription factor [Maribacter algarum]|nr:hybrid sensor histidine kinase/response regulator transcription factor [Maribacter algarum]